MSASGLTTEQNALPEALRGALSNLAHIAIGSLSHSIERYAASELLAYMGDLERQRTEAIAALTAGERLRELALIWSAYQDDDSKRDQLTDPHLRAQAETAERNLLEALL